MSGNGFMHTFVKLDDNVISFNCKKLGGLEIISYDVKKEQIYKNIEIIKGFATQKN